MAKLAHRTKEGPREVAGQPMFCVETAVKCLYWSTLVYDHREVPVQAAMQTAMHSIPPEHLLREGC